MRIWVQDLCDRRHRHLKFHASESVSIPSGDNTLLVRRIIMERAAKVEFHRAGRSPVPEVVPERSDIRMGFE